jgi:hypothetical protein
MSCYLLYGIREASLALVKSELERLIGIIFEERESSYQAGIYYISGPANSEQFLLKRNVDPFDGEPAEQGFPDYPVILYINATERDAELKALVATRSGFALLRDEVF